jgi:HSP20 family protein
LLSFHPAVRKVAIIHIQPPESEGFMAQQERKDRPSQTDTTTERGLQASRGRNELALRDPFSAFWRDPFGSFWNDPFSLFQRGPRRAGMGIQGPWTPQIETFQRGDQFVVRADLPGMKKDDVNIELTDDSLIIEGERREEREEDREGFYRSERSYGSFYRAVPLPEGAIPESAKASFNNGVLEVTIQAPPREVSRKRRVEITESTESGRGEKERAKTEGQR